jgi:hypothetical protein
MIVDDELSILSAALTSHHPKARTKPKNFIRTYDSPENIAVYDAMVAKGMLVREDMPGYCYRVTDLGKQAFKDSGLPRRY